MAWHSGSGLAPASIQRHDVSLRIENTGVVPCSTSALPEYFDLPSNLPRLHAVGRGAFTAIHASRRLLSVGRVSTTLT